MTAGGGGEKIRDELWMALAVFEKYTHLFLPALAFGDGLLQHAEPRAHPYVQKIVDILIMIVKGVGAHAAPPDESRYGDLVKRYFLQHLFKGREDRLLR